MSRNQRGDGRVFRRGTIFWIGYFHRGQEVRESAAGAIREVESRKGRKLTEKEAESVAERFLKERVHQVWAERKGTTPFLGPECERIEVAELLDDLVRHYERGEKKGVTRKVSPPMCSHLARLRRHFGGMRAMNVTKRVVEDFSDLLRAQGKQPATVNRSLQLLSQAFTIAATAQPPKALRGLVIPKLNEESNVRKGHFSEPEAQLIFSSLPPYMADVARFAYETGARSGEIRKLKWEYLDGDLIRVPGKDVKDRKPHIMSVTPEIEEILTRRRAKRAPDCELIFHHNGHAIVDYRKCWQSACLLSGLGQLYCRNCRDENGAYVAALDAKRKCPACGQKSKRPKFIGRLLHDFRRSAAFQLVQAGNTPEEAKEVTGHKTLAMFARYSDLFSDQQKADRQREAQARRRGQRKLEAEQAAARPNAPSGGAASKPCVTERVQ